MASREQRQRRKLPIKQFDVEGVGVVSTLPRHSGPRVVTEANLQQEIDAVTPKGIDPKLRNEKLRPKVTLVRDQEALQRAKAIMKEHAKDLEPKIVQLDVSIETPEIPGRYVIPPDVLAEAQANLQKRGELAADKLPRVNLDPYLPKDTEEQPGVVDIPFGYNFEEHETIALNSGSLRYEDTDFVIPGVNGLDVEIKRVYESTQAQEHEFTFDVETRSAQFYYLYPKGNESYILEVGGPFINSSDVNYYREQAVEAWGGSAIIGHGYESTTNYFHYRTALRDNDQYIQYHKLGRGWRFTFPSIERLPDGFNKRTGIKYRSYLHVGDGNVYKLLDDGTLEDHTLEDFTFTRGGGSFTYPDGTTASASYAVTFKDGKTHHLDDKNIIATTDRFGNRILYKFTDNGLTIWDTLNRAIKMEKYNVVNAGTYRLRWTLPDTRTMSYSVVDYKFREATNFEDETTTYNYSEAPVGARLFYQYSGDEGVQTTTQLLYLITHPTGAVTYYSWGTYTQAVNDDTGRYRTKYVVGYRLNDEVVDQSNWVERNALVYGYGIRAQPKAKASGDKSKEYQFDYYIYENAVQEPGRGTVTTHTFDIRYLRTNEVLRVGNTNKSSKAFSYNSDKLLVQEAATIYGNSQSRTYTERWTYDKKGNLTQHVDRLNHVVNYEYYTDNYSIPKSKKEYRDTGTAYLVENLYALDSAGKSIGSISIQENGTLYTRTDFTYNAQGNPTQKREYDGAGTLLRTTVYSYQDNIKVSRRTIDGMAQASYVFDLLGNVLQKADPNGNISQYWYDEQGRLIRTINPDLTIIDHYYFIGELENTVHTVEERGYQSYKDYTLLGRLAQEADVINQVVLKGYYYDNAYRLWDEYTADENRYVLAWTYYDNDYADRVVSKEIEDLTYGTLLYRESTAYDDAASGRYVKSTKTIQGDGTYAKNIVTTEYQDAMERLVQEGTVISGIERITVHTYDAVGNKLTTLTALDASRGMPYSGKWDYDYANHVVREYQPRASATTAEQYTSMTYDALGRNTKTVDFRGNAINFTYDALDRLTQKTADFEGNATSSVRYEYDANGNILWEHVQCNISAEPAAWKRTEHRYSSRNWVVDTILYKGDANTDYVRTHYEYDEAGNRTHIYAGMTSNSTTGAQLSRYRYNQFNEVTFYFDQDNDWVLYHYDGIGQLNNKQERNGRVIVYVRDALKRVYEESSLDFDTGEFERKVTAYTLTGEVNLVQNQHVGILHFYDEAGRLWQQTQTDGVDKVYGYDIGGNRTSMAITNNGAAVLSQTYTYDYANRMQTVSRSGALVATYTYDANGNRASLNHNASGAVITYTYNKANLVTALSNKAGAGTSLSDFTYTYYLDGNQHIKTGLGETIVYTYDRLNRLTQERDANTGGLTIDYEYDQFSNRKKMTVSGAQSYTVDYTYNVKNWLTRDVKVEGSVTTTTTYSYDANGNQTGISSTGGVVSTTTMVYDGFDQMVLVSKDGATSVYAYRPDGLRYSKTAGGATTVHAWDGTNIAADIGGNAARYVRGVGLIALDMGTLQYYLFNAHGDVVQRTDQNGNVLQVYVYDAFGVERTPIAADTNPFRYRGEYFDREIDVIYLRARYYKPAVGRFWAEDSIHNQVRTLPNNAKVSDPLSLNLYAYCCSNPVYYVDPTGRNTDYIQEILEYFYENFDFTKNFSIELLKRLEQYFNTAASKVSGSFWAIANNVSLDIGAGIGFGANLDTKAVSGALVSKIDIWSVHIEGGALSFRSVKEDSSGVTFFNFINTTSSEVYYRDDYYKFDQDLVLYYADSASWTNDTSNNPLTIELGFGTYWGIGGSVNTEFDYKQAISDIIEVWGK